MAKIVVVGGEVVTRRSLRAALPAEFEIIEAADGPSAVGIVESHHVDIVVADAATADASGHATTVAIKRGAGDRFVPVLLMTASSDESLLAACLQSGADEIVFQPFSPVLLESKIRALLRARDLFEATGRQTKELARYRGHVEAENKIARKVFESITRGQIANLPGIAARSFAMGTFSGDLVLMHTMEDGRLRLLLGDFSGHGLSAAIGAIPVSDVFYAMCRRDLPVARIAVELNAKIHRMMPRNIFLSACIAELDMETHELSVYNAGLPDVLIVSREGRITKRVRSNHVPLGVLPADKFAVTLQRLEVAQDDRILLCSDGVLETLNPENRFLGEDGFNHLVEQANETSWLESIVEQLDDFRRDAERTDDVTLMAIHCGTSLRDALLADRKSLERTELAVDVRYGPEALRDEVALEPFVHALEAYPSLSRHSGELYAVMSELFSNALEHGILRLDSDEKADAAGFLRYYQARKRQLACLKAGEIRMSLRVTTRGGRRIARVRVQDSGPGVGPQNRTPGTLDEGTLAGRGLAMVRSLCERLTFSDAGAVVEADYLLDGDAGHFPLLAKGAVSDSYPTTRPVDLPRT
jgi:serine phosphatase RsbU (regulator of sigma subunit)